MVGCREVRVRGIVTGTKECLRIANKRTSLSPRNSLGATMKGQRVACILIGAEVAALVAFFNYALVAQDIYSNIGEFDPRDELVRYVEWNTCAREALLTVVLLWFVAIGLAIYEYRRT